MSKYPSCSIDAYLYLHIEKPGKVVLYVWMYFHKLFIYNEVVEKVNVTVKFV